MPKIQKYKRTNNDLQNITYKTKDRVTRTSPKTEDELRCSDRLSSYRSTSGTRRATKVTNPVIGHFLLLKNSNLRASFNKETFIFIRYFLIRRVYNS